MLGITSYYLNASSLWRKGCNEDSAPYLVLVWMSHDGEVLVCIIRGSYLTYLWPCVRPGISEDCVPAELFERVCVCVRSLYSVCYPVLTPSRSLLSGVPAGGWASAAAGRTPHWSSPTYRHAAAAVQSAAGEEAVCQNERSSSLHTGTAHCFSSIYFTSVCSLCVIVFVLGSAPENCFKSES